MRSWLWKELRFCCGGQYGLSGCLSGRAQTSWPLASIGIQLVPGDGTGEIRIRFGARDDGHVGNSSPSEMQGADRGHEHAFNLHEEPDEDGVFIEDNEEAGRWTQHAHSDNDDASATAEEEDSGAEAAAGVAEEAVEAAMETPAPSAAILAKSSSLTEHTTWRSSRQLLRSQLNLSR